MKKLSEHASNTYSQFGEDGIVEKIFQIIGVDSKVCVEFGAWDGFYLSNTANLWTNGWKGILIEADVDRYHQLVENVRQYDCHCVCSAVGYAGDDTLEAILRREDIRDDIDFLSIDIDGDDYYVLQSLNELRPRVISCEYNPTIPSHIHLIPEKDNRFGCSAMALVDLAETKGYRLVSMTETNCIFVTEELFQNFSDYCVDLGELATSKHLTYLMTGYDGKYVLSQKPTYMRDELAETGTEFLGDHYKAPEMPSPSTSVEVRVRHAVGRIANKVNSIIKRKDGVDDGPRLKWIRDRGDQTLRLEYELDADSTVFDIGGYEGQWASDIFSRYCCRILVFEPVTEYSKNIRERFRKNDRIQVHPFGLSNDDKKLDIGVNKDSSSIYQISGKTEQIELKRAATFIRDSGIGKIDLMKINIEGGEYELLEDLLDAELIRRIANIQVQFHDFVDDAENRMAKIQARLQRTHHPTYQYRFIWENWALNTQG